MQFLDKSRELHKNPLLKKLILFLVLTLLLYLGVDIFLHQHQIGLTLSTATNNILGNEEEFLDPILFDTLLERTHANILSSMITLMLLALILIRLNPKSTPYLIHFAFISSILSHVLLLLTSNTLFIALWIGFFMLWHVFAFVMGLIIIWRLR
ncbi:MAG: Unknown protein [uncultured Sulfurovum sp.]|uniref:Uncharacterized protein n=1 Tax=uncultured Sulfurovum sp. TaxID=269237 RepID=A0A6S6RUY6_9BACT|nr:MAG: Unknown protein [uncultured Sulfurovum sp.]